MASFNANILLTFVFCFQGTYLVSAIPSHYGGCGGCGEYNNIPINGGGCGPVIAPSPPISFLPVPQPFPIRVPVPPKQSVTIPNIILALLPPTNKPPCAPKPIVKPIPPSPIRLPLPQPYSYPVPGYGSASYGCGPVC